MAALSSPQSPITPVHRRSLAQLVQAELERQILSGQLAAGNRLNEVALAQRLDVSRGPIREALRSLEAAGLVSFEKNRGAAVRVVTAEAAIEIYEVRAALEALACRRVALHAPLAEVQALHSLVDQMEAAAQKDDVVGFNELNIAFHERLVELSASGELAASYRRLMGNLALFRLRTLAAEGSLTESNAEHRQILDCITARDPVAAAGHMQDHIESSSRRTQHALVAQPPGGA